MASSSARWRSPVHAALAVAIVIPAAWLLLARLSRPEPPVATVADFCRLLEAGNYYALTRARAFADAHDRDLMPEWRRVLENASARIRAGACDVLGTRHNPADLRLILPRASDTDYAVRARAFGALSRFAPLPLAQQETPLDERENDLLTWLEAYDRTASLKLAPQICELYAQSTWLEFGRPLSARCLGCHAGGTPAAFASSTSCQDCHPAIYTAWSRSAHANSLVHLHLRTVDPPTRQSQWLEFGEVRGISCGECHPRATGTTTFNPAASKPGCRMGYVRAPADICARCHADIQRQWGQWRAGPQPRRVAWPPGEVDPGARGDERSCIDCHMSAVPAAGPTIIDHRWAARRDLELLRSGLNVQVLPVAEDGTMQTRLTLTNLSGHAYPTGTCRRRLEIYLGASDAGAPPLLTTLGSEYPGDASPGLEPPLRPGEQRTWSLPLSESDGFPGCRVRYVRNRDDPALYAIDVYSNVAATSPSMVP